MELKEWHKQAISAYERHNRNESAAAKELGIDPKALRSRLWSAVKNGWPVQANTFCEHAPVGFGLKAQSILTNADGETVLTWHKVDKEKQSIADFAEYLKHQIPAAPIQLTYPVACNSDLMLEWCIYDHHQGLLSWANETGADYDNAIARKLMINAAKKIFAENRSLEQIVIVGGGDNNHADTRRNMTEKSGHILDVDSRYQKTAWITYETWITVINMALMHGKSVHVIVLSGNHDYHLAIMLAMVLTAHYRDEPRVNIDTCPAKHRFFRWGSNMFMYTHGDTGMKRLSSYMMNHIIKSDITGIDRMYIRAGHLHKIKRTVDDIDGSYGPVIELFPTLAAPDAFAHEQAYVDYRATVATKWHKKWGKRGFIECGVKELMEDE